MPSKRELRENLNLLKKTIEKTEGEPILDSEFIIIDADDLDSILKSCSAILGYFDMDLDTREIYGG